LVGTDPRTDIGLLKINSDNSFVAAKIGNSDNIKIGEWVMTMGSPFGLQNSITAGIIGGKNRPSETPGLYSSFIQVDAAINPGNSGGPLFNFKGEVIGINTMVVISDGINSNVGFAIPINTAMFIVNQLRRNGEVIRGRIGVIVQNITYELKKQHKLKSRVGVFVRDVPKNSPADKAGLKVGDVIVEFNNEKIKYIHELVYIVSMSPIEKKLEIVVLRNNERKVLTVILKKSDLSNVISVSELQNKFGFSVTIINNELAKKFAKKNNTTIEEIEGRIIVLEVVTESSACLSGLKKDDIIVTINTKPIKSVEDYTMAILKLSLKKPFLMTVLRDGYIKYLVLSIKAGEAL
jgi:serine protease Do